MSSAVQVPIYRQGGALVAHALVDPEDAPAVLALRWNLSASGYACHRYTRRPHKGTHAQNQQNIAGSRNASSRYRGVYFRRDERRWCVLVQVHRVRHHGGRFATEEAAARAASELRQRLMPFSNEARAA